MGLRTVLRLSGDEQMDADISVASAGLIVAQERESPPLPAAVSGRISGLDGLRAIAVGVVFLAHYTPFVLPGQPWLAALFPGMVGVTLFFFISGYLISSLLLKEHHATGTIRLRNFYIRRLLRLSPALYVYVAVTLVAYLWYDRQVRYGDFIAALTYTSNYYQIWANTAMYYMPVWSLAIEEHFYLIWPAVMLLCLQRSPERLMIGVIGSIAVVALWRSYLVHTYAMNWLHIYWRTDTRLDAIFAGVLLTCIVTQPKLGAVRAFIASHWSLGLGVAVLAFSIVYREEAFRMSSRYTLQGLALLLIIGAVLLDQGWGGRLARATLDTPPMLFLSKISYSLYLWHLTVLKFAEHVHGSVGPLLALACAALSFTLAIGSYHVIEAPILVLRRRFGSHAAI